ncbi:hypothetical protein NDU88_003006 [Pleurodeles waltl]|uniref:Uncharacterized protein n=1 Tax=Pleurodeles waltl TaxID=8319 RepID=A0AAV7SG01_PLEWA|nr:hypothetical protein NDU88_003006 [Pleurodeles waltl]
MAAPGPRRAPSIMSGWRTICLSPGLLKGSTAEKKTGLRRSGAEVVSQVRSGMGLDWDRGLRGRLMQAQQGGKAAPRHRPEKRNGQAVYPA